MAEKENSKSENTETKKNEQIREYGQTKLEHNIHLLSVIGEIEGMPFLQYKNYKVRARPSSACCH